jgi:hypothetical protein
MIVELIEFLMDLFSAWIGIGMREDDTDTGRWFRNIECKDGKEPKPKL